MKNDFTNPTAYEEDRLVKALKEAAKLSKPGGSATATNAAAKAEQLMLKQKAAKRDSMPDGMLQTDADIARKLPPDFPVDNWESMRTAAQQKAISKTDLTKQEQWRLLNTNSTMRDLVAQGKPTTTATNSDEGNSKASGIFTGADAKTLKTEQNALRVSSPSKTVDIKSAFTKPDAATMREEQRVLGEVTQGNTFMNDILTSINLDLANLTPVQQNVVGFARLKLTQQALDGVLTPDSLKQITYDAARIIATQTTPPEGTTYKILIDVADPNRKTKPILPELGTMQSDVLNKEEWELFMQNTNNGYKDLLYQEAINNYYTALEDGSVRKGEVQEFYDQAVRKFYNMCVKPVYIETIVNDKKVKAYIPIGDLIPPEDDSFGAQLVREAMRLMGLGYNKPAAQGEEPGIRIDCQGFVRWAIAQINPEWGKYGIGKGARYQINDSIKIWNVEGGTSVDQIKLQIGDTLFWRGDESGTIKHTAIYIGKLGDIKLMIEAGDTVQIVPLRESTTNSNGEDSTLYQVNRVTPERLQENVETYLQTHTR